MSSGQLLLLLIADSQTRTELIVVYIYILMLRVVCVCGFLECCDIVGLMTVRESSLTLSNTRGSSWEVFEILV